MDLLRQLEGTTVQADSTDDVLEGLSFAPTHGGLSDPLTVTYVRDLTEADIDLLRSGARGDPSASLPERIAALTHRHHLAARMIADGAPNIDVAYATGYSGSHISHLRGDPAFIELVNSYAGQKDQVYLDVHQRLGSLAMSAVDALQRRVDHLESIGDDPIADAKAEVQRKVMSHSTLLDVAELALDRSIAPALRANAANGGRNPVDIGGGLVVNLNFAEPKRDGAIVDVTPAGSGNAGA